MHMSDCCQPGVHPDPNETQSHFRFCHIRLYCQSLEKFKELFVEQANNINQLPSFVDNVIKYKKILFYVSFHVKLLFMYPLTSKENAHTLVLSCLFLTCSGHLSAFYFFPYHFYPITDSLSVTLMLFTNIPECSFSIEL
jgi:hypothetical protein